MIFRYDASRQELVFPNPEPGEFTPLRAHVNDLRRMGWRVTEADLQRALPRAASL